MGEVFVARDTELDREVRVKEIQGQHAHDAGSKSRFVMEAEITGKLEHPGIVPVYGLGSYPDGRPFYAMKFIKGDSLHEAVNQFHKSSSRGNSGRGMHSSRSRFASCWDGLWMSAMPWVMPMRGACCIGI